MPEPTTSPPINHQRQTYKHPIQTQHNTLSHPGSTTKKRKKKKSKQSTAPYWNPFTPHYRAATTQTHHHTAATTRRLIPTNTMTESKTPTKTLQKPQEKHTKSKRDPFERRPRSRSTMPKKLSLNQ